MINHQIIMVNAMNKRGDSSVVKFGGWDQNALADGSSLTVLRTKDETSYTLIASKFFYGTHDLLPNTGVTKDIELSPHLPYLYVPDADATHLFTEINKIY